jgi:hypothetical protein
MESCRLSELRFLGLFGGVVEGVEFVIITLGTDVLNNVSFSPLIGDTFGEVVEVELEDWFITLLSPFSADKRKLICIIIQKLLHLAVTVSMQIKLM